MFLDSRLGNTPRWFLRPPKDWKMRVPDAVSGCVVFVGRIMPAGTEERKRFLGTAFVVAVPSEGFFDSCYLYIVTARHVARQLSLGGQWFVRVNRRGGGSIEGRADDGSAWWYHPTEPGAVDAAVHEMVVSEEMDFTTVPIGNFLTEDSLKNHDIGPGDMVFFTGLFTKVFGQKRNVPLIRLGNLAMVPTEKIPIRIEKEIVQSEVYLVEARSFGGLSGSPVFVRETVYFGATVGQDQREMQMPLPGAFHLLGVMHGHWDINKEDYNEIEMPYPKEGEEPLNLGVAIVTPAKKILEILYRPELVESRRQQDRRRREREGWTIQD